MKNIVSYVNGHRNVNISALSYMEAYFHRTLVISSEKHIHDSITGVFMGAIVVILNLLSGCIMTPRFDTSNNTPYNLVYQDNVSVRSVNVRFWPHIYLVKWGFSEFRLQNVCKMPNLSLFSFKIIGSIYQITYWIWRSVVDAMRTCSNTQEIILQMAWRCNLFWRRLKQCNEKFCRSTWHYPI